MRLSVHPKMIDISGQMSAFRNYLSHNDQIVTIFLFGSYDTKYQTPLSDLDLAILTREPVSDEEELEILSTVSSILQEDDVNITFLNKTNLLMQYKILSTGRLLYCADQIVLADFTEGVIKFYGDFQIDLEQFYREYDRKLREEYLYGR